MNPCKLIILGGTGFVGTHLLARLSSAGYSVTVPSRQCQRHRALKVLPGVRLRHLDVYDDTALRQALEGMDAVINLIGILNPAGDHTFHRVHVELTRRLIVACQIAGVSRLHQMSSLKAGQGLSDYLKTRGEAEKRLKDSPLHWTLYQPSVIFGAGDGLVNRFAMLLRRLPILPLARADARMAPTWVGDVTAAIAHCISTDHAGQGRSHQLYGPEILTLGDMVRAIRDSAGMRTPIVPLPDRLGRLQARIAEWLPGPPFSLDNFLSLCTDSIGTDNGYQTLGIDPVPFTPSLPALLHNHTRQHQLNEARRHISRR